MPHDQSLSLAEVVALIERAADLLQTAEGALDSALQAADLPHDAPEVERLAELLDGATHETQGELRLAVQDIQMLIAKAELRRKYSMLRREHFEQAVRRGWSTGLAHELQQHYPTIPLRELSASIKRLCEEWGTFSKVQATE